VVIAFNKPSMSTLRYATRPQPFQYPVPSTSRSLYPTFLSFQDSALLQLTWAWRGLYDAFRWNAVVSVVTRCVQSCRQHYTYLPYFPSFATRPHVNPLYQSTFKISSSDSEIRANVYKSLMLNSVSLLSIQIFDLLLQPLVQDQQKWFHRNIGWFYHVLWLLPVVGTSLYLNVRPSVVPFARSQKTGLRFLSWASRAPGARSSRNGHTCSSMVVVLRLPSQRRTRACCAR